MAKRCLIFLLFVLFISKLNSQTVNIPLIFTDGAGFSHTLYFGLDSTATDGLDPHLGEFECPPCPPVDITDVRFNLLPFTGLPIHTYKDYRNAPNFPYTGVKQHRLIWQLYSESAGLTVTYDLPENIYIVVTSNSNNPIYSANLVGNGSFNFPYPEDLFSARMFVYYSGGSFTDSSMLSFTPGQLDFGFVNPYEVHNKVLNVKNIGINNLIKIDSCKIQNGNNCYSITAPSGFPVTLYPGQSVNFNVQILTNPQSDSTSVVFYHNGIGLISRIPLYYRVNNSNYTTADISGKLLVSSGAFQHWLGFGLDSTATDGIDIHLGELEIPPPCPPTCFDTRFILPIFNFGSIYCYTDYRFALQPFNGQKEYRIYQQPFENENVKIFWDLPEGVTGYIQDLPIGSDINIPIADTGSFIITQPYDYPILRLLINYNLDSVNPVELTTFYASIEKNSVVLNWTTSTETNNYGFEIQRKRALKLEEASYDWENIGFIIGNGTTTTQNSYKFIDNDIKECKYQYRLKQIDYDGTFQYSNEIEVITNYIPDKYSLEQNYPNPFNPSTVISFSLPEDASNVRLTIYDALGQKVAELVNRKLEAGKYQYSWNASNNATGLYIYELRTDKFVSVKKMMLMK